MQNKKLFFILIISIKVVCADNKPTVVVASKTNISPQTQSINLNIKSPAILEADKDYELLNKYKRQNAIQIEKDKLKMQVNNSNGSTNNMLGEPTATNIVINTNGNKFATLSFSDGSSLVVERGSQIGKYKVKDILISGVLVSTCLNNCKQILIKRAYPVEPGFSSHGKMELRHPTNVLDSNFTVPPIQIIN